MMEPTRRAFVAASAVTAALGALPALAHKPDPDADTGLGLLSDSEIRLVACYRQAGKGVREMLEAACDLWPPNPEATGGHRHA